MTPESFPKVFATSFVARDSDALTALQAEVSEAMTVNGALAKTAIEAWHLYDMEFLERVAAVLIQDSHEG